MASVPLIGCRNDSERARLLDMSRRLRPVERRATGLFLLAGIVGIPTFGWLPLLPTGMAITAFWVLQGRLDRYKRPELVLAGSWLFAQLMIASAIALASGPRLYLLPMFIFSMMLASVAFPARTVVLGGTITILLMAGLAYLLEAQAALDNPFLLVSPALVLAAAAIPAAAVRDLDVISRGSAVVDQLTGVLNRVALEGRVAELSYQALATSEPVAVIVGDVDEFKSINDGHGHTTGDQVLKELAYRLSSALGAFEPVYRYGGDEFVIPLPGADTATAAQVANRLREAVREPPMVDIAVTMSFGVAATGPGEPFEFQSVFGRADAALYAAKVAGRDSVRVAGGSDAGVERALETSDVLDARATEAAEGGRVHSRCRDTEMLEGVETPTVDRWRMRMAHHHKSTGSWLIEDEQQREHLMALNHRLHRTNRGAYGLAFLSVILAAPMFGWATLIAPIVGAVIYNVAERRLDRFKRPEYALGVAWLLAQLGNSLGFWFVRAPAMFALPLLILLVVGSSAVFPRRALLAGTGFTGLLLVAAALHMDAHQVLHQPGIVAFQLALLGTVALIGSVTGQSAVDHRSAAMVDRLTGMLNRGALESRIAELTHQAAVTGQQVAVVVGDLDRFKAVNDSHGHAAGDAVLKEVAQRMRKHLRAFESAYRFGGEEFVVLLPGVDVEGAENVAERVWRAVREAPVADMPLTISFGVAASRPGEAFDFESVFARADGLLYDAKRSGRDQVLVDTAAPQPELAAA